MDCSSGRRLRKKRPQGELIRGLVELPRLEGKAAGGIEPWTFPAAAAAAGELNRGLFQLPSLGKSGRGGIEPWIFQRPLKTKNGRKGN